MNEEKLTASQLQDEINKYTSAFGVSVGFAFMMSIALFCRNFMALGCIVLAVAICVGIIDMILCSVGDDLGKQKADIYNITESNEDLKARAICVNRIFVVKDPPKAVIIDIKEEPEKPKSEAPPPPKPPPQPKPKPKPTEEEFPLLNPNEYIFRKTLQNLTGLRTEDLQPQGSSKALAMNAPIPKIVMGIAAGISGTTKEAKEYRANVAMTFLELRRLSGS